MREVAVTQAAGPTNFSSRPVKPPHKDALHGMGGSFFFFFFFEPQQAAADPARL